MTDVKILDELERLSKAATPGPWTAWAWRVFGGDGKLRLAKFDGSENATGHSDSCLTAALRNSADSLIRDARRLQRLEQAAREISVNHLPWCPYGVTSATCECGMKALREALEDRGAGEE